MNLFYFLLKRGINYSKISYFINILFIIIFIIMAFILIYIFLKKKKLENKYNQMMEFLEKYEHIIDEQGKKNHEYNNQLMILNGYLDNKKKLKEYLDSIIEDHKTGKNYEIRQLSHFPNGGLKGMIYYKLYKMKSNNIKFYLYVSDEVKEKFEKIEINTYKDITKIFGVFIDNAIDAALISSKKEIELDFKVDDNYIVITISNTFDEKTNLKKVGEKGFTTKGVGHGFGLQLVKDLVRKNDKLEVVNDIKNEMYVQTLLIDID